MISDKVIERLSKSILQQDAPALQDMSVLQDRQGNYRLFNKYTIKKSNYMFSVSHDTMINKMEFANLKSAVAWCTFDKRNKISDTKRIFELDQKLCGIETSILHLQKLIKKSKSTENQLIYIAKLTEDKTRRHLLSIELNSYINASRIWQNKRFNAKT